VIVATSRSGSPPTVVKAESAPAANTQPLGLQGSRRDQRTETGLPKPFARNTPSPAVNPPASPSS
jgi:hypothetical protein